MRRYALSKRHANAKFRNGLSHTKSINWTYMMKRGGVCL